MTTFLRWAVGVKNKYLWLTIVIIKASHQSNYSQPSIELQLAVFTKLFEDLLDIRSSGKTSFTGPKSNFRDLIIFFILYIKMFFNDA